LRPGRWVCWKAGDWQAEWIGNDLTAYGRGEIYHLPPAPFFRKEAEVRSGCKKARLYVTALGIYEFEINGKRVGNDYFAPGWTDYDKRVYYQTYDVTDLVRRGTNAFGAILPMAGMQVTWGMRCWSETLWSGAFMENSPS
jgi:alpha-L-rhamnosidase